MPRLVTYQVFDLPDGRFAVAATIGSATTHVRINFKTRAEADAAIDELRQIMTAMGAPFSHAASEHPDFRIDSSITAQT